MLLESEDFDKEFVEALNKASEQNSGTRNLNFYFVLGPNIGLHVKIIKNINLSTSRVLISMFILSMVYFVVVF